jgi:hypothetical protein
MFAPHGYCRPSTVALAVMDTIDECLPAAGTNAAAENKWASARPVGSSDIRLHHFAHAENRVNVAQWPITAQSKISNLRQLLGAKRKGS